MRGAQATKRAKNGRTRNTGTEQRVGRLAFARLGELDVLDKVVEDLLFLGSEAGVVGFVPVEVENRGCNAMSNFVLVCVFAFVAGLVLAPICSKHVFELAFELG